MSKQAKKTMRDNQKSKVDLLQELNALRQRVCELEQAKVELKKKEESLGKGADFPNRKRADEVLQESEQKWRLLAENIPDAILTADKDGRIQFLNRTIVGFTPEDTIGTSVYEYVPADQHHIMRKAIERVFLTGKPERYEIEGTGEHGPNTKWETRVVPIIRDGQVVAVNLICTDITERRKTEEELRVFEERFSGLAESSFDLIFMTDAQGCLTYVSDASEKIFHYKPEEMVGTHFKNYLIESEIPRVSQRFAENMQGRNLGIFPMEAMRRDGSHVFIELNSSPIVKDGETIGIQGIIRDITERKRAEETLRESEEKYRKLFEETTDAIFVADAETGILTDCNYAASELVGREKSELIGKHQRILHPPQEVEGEFSRTFKQHLMWLSRANGTVMTSESILLKYKHLPPWTSQSQFRPFCATITPTNRVCTYLGGCLNGLMNKNLDVITHAVTLIIKAAIMAARFSGRVRKRSLKRLATMDADTKDKEILFLKDKVYQLEMQVSILQKRIQKRQKKPRYTLRERLFILWHIETFGIARRKVTEHIGVSRSTLYRWLHQINDTRHTRIPANKTRLEIAVLIWEITKSNIDWGRVRIANQLALLNIFISASTVRNILNRPKPPKQPISQTKPKKTEDIKERSIPAWYPNHVWSIDTTMVFCWGLWLIHVCVVIDHFSRKVMAAVPLEGPNAGWINDALESAIEKHGAPKHIISDQVSVFTGEVFAELLDSWNIKPRLGAVGKHGSISVTERVIKTLKYEWLKRAAIIKDFDHLTILCEEFEIWYNSWRPHMTLDGLRPDDVYYEKKPEKPKRDAKTVPCNIEQRFFRETRITGYRLKNVA